MHSPGVGACLGTAQEAGVTNLRVLCHDAVEVLEHMIPNGSSPACSSSSRPPGTQSRHQSAASCSRPLPRTIRQKLAIGGVFHMATDWKTTPSTCWVMVSAAEGYENTSASGNWVPVPTGARLTKFEQRGHRLGHGVWDLIFQTGQLSQRIN